MIMTDSTQTLSLGQQLSDARNQLAISITDVAQKTNLKKNHIEAFENDIFILENVPPAFVRGYVRGYVRFLRLPEELVNTVSYGEVTLSQTNAVKAKPIPVTNSKSQMRWLKWLTWLILLGAAGMTLAWWWQEHKKEQASSAQLVSENQDNAIAVNVPSSNTDNMIAIQQSETTQTALTSEPVSVQPVNNSQTETQPVVETQKVEEKPVETAVETKVETLPTLTPIETATAPTVEVAPQTETVNVLQQVTEQTTPKVEEQPQVVSNDELRIEIVNAPSWITVRGVKNKKLAEKLYNAGEVLTFNDNEQYRLTVGAPANVKIYYKGQVVPLKVDGRVARFKLPLAN